MEIVKKNEKNEKKREEDTKKGESRGVGVMRWRWRR